MKYQFLGTIPSKQHMGSVMFTNHVDIIEISEEKVQSLFNALTNGKDHIKVEELSNRIINTNVIPEGDDVKTKDKEAMILLNLNQTLTYIKLTSLIPLK